MYSDVWGKLFDDRSQPSSVQSEERGGKSGILMEGVDCLIKEREETSVFGVWGIREVQTIGDTKCNVFLIRSLSLTSDGEGWISEEDTLSMLGQHRMPSSYTI